MQHVLLLCKWCLLWGYLNWSTLINDIRRATSVNNNHFEVPLKCYFSGNFHGLNLLWRIVRRTGVCLRMVQFFCTYLVPPIYVKRTSIEIICALPPHALGCGGRMAGVRMNVKGYRRYQTSAIKLSVHRPSWTFTVYLFCIFDTWQIYHFHKINNGKY